MLKVKFCIILWASLSSSLFALMSVEPALEISEWCALAPNSVILKPNNCTNWLKCPSEPGISDIEEGACVFGLYFNKNTGKCEYQDNVQCPYETIEPTQNRCTPETEGTFLADSEHCSAYIYCQNGEEKKGNCTGGLVFDAIKKACVYKHLYKCPEPKPTNSLNLMCLSLKDGTAFADKHDCKKFSICRQNVLESHSCNSSSAWHYIEQRCVLVDGVECYPTAKKPEPELKVCVDREGPISDGTSCSGYYFCRKMVNDTYDRKPQHFNCPPGNFFDSNTISCRDRLNVKCSLDRCEGMGNKYVNIAGNCRAYALCANGVAKAKNVCENNYYFDERTQGCTPQIVSYAACLA